MHHIALMTFEPSARPQILSMSSLPPEIRCRPSGLYSMVRTVPSWPFMLSVRFQSLVLHTSIRCESPAVARLLPSGEKRTAKFEVVSPGLMDVIS